MVGRDLDAMFPKEIVPIGDVALSVKNLALEGVFHDVSFDLRKGEILGLAGLVGGRANQRRGDHLRSNSGHVGRNFRQR